MSYLDTPSFWQRWSGRVRLDAPRTAGVIAIAAAAALTLSWPGPIMGAFGVAQRDTKDTDYLIRLPLTDAKSMPMEELAVLTREDDALADLAIEQGIANEETIARRRNSEAFNRAFGDLGPRERQAELAPGDFISVDYDIGTIDTVPEKYDRSDGSLTIEKPLFVDGVSSGPARIRIEEGAQILIATSSVARALGERASTLPRRITTALADGDGFIPFYELRGAGISVEYDAARDRVSMTMPSERGD